MVIWGMKSAEEEAKKEAQKMKWHVIEIWDTVDR